MKKLLYPFIKIRNFFYWCILGILFVRGVIIDEYNRRKSMNTEQEIS